jgi:branched-chain amino acid transport system ATP-binding protein
VSAHAILDVRGLHAAYGRIEVLRGVDLSVPAGAVVALLGANGGGKTTLLRTLSGLLRPTAGEVWLGGVQVTGAPADALSRAGLCTVPEGRGVFPNLTVAENLRLASYSGVPAGQLVADAFHRFPVLAARRGQLAGTLSGGEQQMLALARALASAPALLLLDELSLGLAPRVVDELYDTVAAIADHGVSVLVVEQFARSALRVADHAAVMHGGRIVARGEPEEIHDHLTRYFLGGVG